MTRRLIITAILLLASIDGFAEERVTLFEGFDLKLQRLTDAMTDKKSCALFVTAHPVYLSIQGPADVTIWPHAEDLFLAFDGEHLVRIGDSPAEGLKYLSKRNGLVPADAKQAARIVKALAAKTPVKIRYIAWPSHDPGDVTVSAPAFAYVWGIAEKQCGWPSLGVPAELPPAEISVYHSKDNDGYAAVSVESNKDLTLVRDAARHGSACTIHVGVHDTVSVKNGSWNSRQNKGELIVRDQAGKVVFEEKFPPFDGGPPGGTRWAKAEDAALAMWSVAPLGSVSVVGNSYEIENVPLYGFREMWNWGLENCPLPKLATSSP
jgi:hypothetical protein